MFGPADRQLNRRDADIYEFCSMYFVERRHAKCDLLTNMGIMLKNVGQFILFSSIPIHDSPTIRRCISCAAIKASLDKENNKKLRLQELFIAAGTSLPISYLATVGGYTEPQQVRPAVFLLRVFVAVGSYLPSRCLATKGGIYFAEHLPSNDRGIHRITTGAASSFIVACIRCSGIVFTEPLPSNERRDTLCRAFA
jgi:hypothetical protein